MRPFDVQTVSTSDAPAVARLSSDGSAFFSPSSFGSTCQNAWVPTAAMVGISQFSSPSSTRAGVPMEPPS